MAMTRTNSAFFVILEAAVSFFHRKFDEVKEARARRKIYNETYAELAAMSDRNLKDFGASRSGIQRMALEAAYGE